MDRARIKRPGFDQRLAEFKEAVFALPWVADRVTGGHQFDAYEVGDEDDELDDDDVEFSLCLGPITDARFLCTIEGRDRATLIEAALKVATEAFRENLATNEDGRS